MKPLKTLFAIAVLALVTATPPAFAAGEVNLYSARKEELIKPLLDRFSAATGIKVNLVTGKADALLKRLENKVEGLEELIVLFALNLRTEEIMTA